MGGATWVTKAEKIDPAPRIHPTDNRKTLKSGQIPNAIPLTHKWRCVDLVRRNSFGRS